MLVNGPSFHSKYVHSFVNHVTITGWFTGDCVWNTCHPLVYRGLLSEYRQPTSQQTNPQIKAIQTKPSQTEPCQSKIQNSETTPSTDPIAQSVPINNDMSQLIQGILRQLSSAAAATQTPVPGTTPTQQGCIIVMSLWMITVWWFTNSMSSLYQYSNISQL